MNKKILQASLKQLAPDVYAWIAAQGDSNAGAVATRNGLIAIDAQQSAAQGRTFRAAIESRTQARTSLLVDTHFHLDHTAGNVVFADVPILAQARTPALMNDYMGTIQETRWQVDDIDQRLRLFFGSNFNELIPSYDPLYEWFVTRVRRPELDDLQLVAPTETFDTHASYEYAGGTIHLNYLGPAHCEGDLFVHLPEQKIALLGDLVFVGRFPWLGDCDLDGWINCLSLIRTLDLDLVVPGHGDVCTLKEVDAFRSLLVALRDAVSARIDAGASEEATIREVVLPEYAGLPRYREWLPANIRAIYRYLKP